MPNQEEAPLRTLAAGNARPGGRAPSNRFPGGITVVTAIMLCACVSQEPKNPPSKLQRNAEAYCREQGFRPGTEDYEICVERTKEEIIARARASYQRLIRGEDR